MPEKANSMNNNISVLPADFDGLFRFTNFTNEEFTAKWGGIEYSFPALKTSPMIIRNATPEEIQNIRKKFAKELAEREFYKSKRAKTLESMNPQGQVNSFRTAVTYSQDELNPFIQRCLEPLPIASAKVEMKAKGEPSFRKDNKGRNVTRVLEEGDSLIAEGTPMGA